jgi:hypothetical protein
MRDPTRLQAGGGATPFERQLLEAARDERPSPALKLRLEQALGLPASAPVAAATAAAVKASLVAWVSAGILTVGFGGGMLGAWMVARARLPPATASAAPAAFTMAPPPPEPSGLPAAAGQAPMVPASTPGQPERRALPVAGKRIAAGRERLQPAAGDLRGEIALIDAARDALAAPSPARAREIQRRYIWRYPSGTFAPEAVALRVEALQRLGEHRQARGLAHQFIAAHPDSPLAERIDGLLDDADPPAAPAAHP